MNELSAITGNEVEEDTTQAETSTPLVVETQTVADISPPTIAEPILPTTTINTVELLKSRIEMYKLAEKIAKESGDSSRARSRGRGVKNLESLLKQALSGKTINPDEIPPVVSTKAPNAPPTLDGSVATEALHQTEQQTLNPEPHPESTASQTVDANKITTPPAANEAKINALLGRQREYKMAALTAKKSGDTTTALQYVKIAKIFDTVLMSARNGEAVDLSDMPPPPNELPSDMLKAVGQPQTPAPPPSAPKQENVMQQATDGNKSNSTNENPGESIQKQKPVELSPPEVPKTILEALIQRLQKYQSVEATAKAEGNDRKARQNGRIVKQYQDAIKAHKGGRPVNFEELPTPPGYAPIPLTTSPTPAPAPTPPRPSPGPSQSSTVPQSDDQSPQSSSPKRSPMKRQDSRVSGNHSNTSVMNKTIEILLERQRDFKEAALEAKKAGEMEQAKEFLKTYKGIDNLLNVARGGLPVDLSSLPISPKQREKLNDTFEMLSDSEDNEASSNDLKDVYDRLEKQLTKQLEKCKSWR